MALRINNNIAAINAHRNLVLTTTNLSNSMEKLSSGYRINRAADNPAGLVISEQFRAQIAGLNRAIDNSEGSMNMIQTAEGALTEINNLLVKMRELAIHAANEGFNDTAQLEADQAEIDNSILTIDRIAANTQFGTKKLIDGSNANTAVFAGASAGASGMNIRESFLSDGTHYITATKTSESSATVNTEVYGVSVDTSVVPANLTEGAHEMNVIQASAAAVKDNGTAINYIDASGNINDDYGNGITFAAAATRAEVEASTWGTLQGAGVDAGTYTIGLGYQEAGGTAVTGTLTITVGAGGATLNTVISKLNTAIGGSTNLATNVVATIGAGGDVAFMAVGTGADYSVNIESNSFVDAGGGELAGMVFTVGDDARGASDNELQFAVVTNDSYGLTSTITKTITIAPGEFNTLASVITNVNARLGQAIGTGFGTVAAGVNNITAATSGSNDEMIKFTLSDEGSAYSIQSLDTNAGGVTEAAHALGITIDTVAIEGTDAVIELDGYTNSLDRVDYGASRDYTIASAAAGESDRGTVGLTIAGITASGGGVNIGDMLLDVSAARYAVNLNGGAANTVIAGVDTIVSDSSGDERIRINIDLDATGGSETINNTDQSLVFQIGANVGQTAKISLRNMAASTLGKNIAGNMFVSLADIDVTSSQAAQDAQEIIDEAIDEVSTVRGTLGSFQKNTLESNLRNLRIASQNLQASESNIRDTDMAEEMSTFVKSQILLQAGTAMLAQSNQVPQVVLSLFG
jgi:flagellin